MDIYIESAITMTNSYSYTGYGGVFYISEAGTIEINDSTFETFSSS